MKRRSILKALVGLLFPRTKEKEIISALSSKPTTIIGENALKSVEGGFHRNIGLGYEAGQNNIAIGYKGLQRICFKD